MMRGISIAFLVCALFLPIQAMAQTGSLQVTCEPGVRIYIDHQFFGMTNETDNGLFIEELAPGTHRLKAVRSGFAPVVQEVDVVQDVAVEAVIDFEASGEAAGAEEAPEGAAKPAIPKGRTNVGTLLLSSDPVGAKVFIDGEYKGDADIVVDNREAGRHTIVFQMGDRKLSGTFTLSRHEVLKLQANFLYENIINLSERERRQRSNKPIPVR
jgi:hypothetical protein